MYDDDDIFGPGGLSDDLGAHAPDNDDPPLVTSAHLLWCIRMEAEPGARAGWGQRCGHERPTRPGQGRAGEPVRVVAAVIRVH